MGRRLRFCQIDMITKTQWEEFEQHYLVQVLKTPDYRLGQAFLNYFPNITEQMIEQGVNGSINEFRLYNETDPAKCKTVIEQFVNPNWITL